MRKRLLRLCVKSRFFSRLYTQVNYFLHKPLFMLRLFQNIYHEAFSNKPLSTKEISERVEMALADCKESFRKNARERTVKFGNKRKHCLLVNKNMIYITLN